MPHAPPVTRSIRAPCGAASVPTPELPPVCSSVARLGGTADPDPRKTRLAGQRTSLPPSTQVAFPTVTVASVKKFHLTYPPPTAPPSSVLSPRLKRTTPAP